VAIRALNEESSAEIVTERLDTDRDSARFLAALIRHLHAFVCETRPTRDNWSSAIRLLTEVGHATDDRRQEWVLASDLLGVTALLEEINTRRPKGATPNTVRGPFYRADAPRVADGADICLDGKGEPVDVVAHVIDLDGCPVAGAVVETWQANGEGLYENQQPDRQPEFNLRGILTTDQAGRVRYRTIRPAGYATPADGPVGKMLARYGFPLKRPAHLHFIIRATGFESISTHVFDRSDPLLGQDALFGVKPELIGDFKRKDDRWSLDFTFVMARAKQERRAA
jgi:hydroxyquinol 1,2-dioxygenase